MQLRCEYVGGFKFQTRICLRSGRPFASRVGLLSRLMMVMSIVLGLRRQTALRDSNSTHSAVHCKRPHWSRLTGPQASWRKNLVSVLRKTQRIGHRCLQKVAVLPCSEQPSAVQQTNYYLSNVPTTVRLFFVRNGP